MKTDAVKYRYRDKQTGEWVTGMFDGVKTILEYDTREMAELLFGGLSDYGIEAEIVEV